jgi:hypothetical protein
MRTLFILVALSLQLFGAEVPKAEPSWKSFFVEGKHKGTFDFTPNPTDNIPPAIKETSIFKDYSLIIIFTNLVPKKESVAKITCVDPEGKKVLSVEHSFTPVNPYGFTIVPFSRAPEDVPGLYRWKVAINDGKATDHTLSLLPETPDGIKKSPAHEKAAENIFRAFTLYWLGINGDCFYVLQSKGEDVRTKVTNYVNMRTGTKTRTKPADFTLEKPIFFGGNEPYYTVEVKTENATAPSVRRLLQVKGMDPDFSQPWGISEAERLNGITYKGSGHFSFSVYRIYSEDDGWGDWIDVESGKGGIGRSLPLNFTVIERDGNWLVTSTETGAKFINGSWSESGDKSENFSYAPSAEYVREILARGKNFKRDALQAEGRYTRESPEEIEQDAINTIFQLRGRTVGE